jgi:3-hydroxybutyrate dehydrogenase
MYVASKHALSGFVRSLDRLENPPHPHLPKIRVNAVAPARILTPLWTENPDKMKMVNQDDPGWIAPEEVASVMLELVEKEEYVGGTIVEVGEKVRRVEAFGDPGPYGSGNGVEHDVGVETDMWASLGEMYRK